MLNPPQDVKNSPALLSLWTLEIPAPPSSPASPPPTNCPAAPLITIRLPKRNDNMTEQAEPPRPYRKAEIATVAVLLSLAVASFAGNILYGWPHANAAIGLAMGSILAQTTITLLRYRLQPQEVHGPFPVSEAGIALLALGFITLIIVGPSLPGIFAGIAIMGSGMALTYWSFFVKTRAKLRSKRDQAASSR